ncbi:long chain acyl-CoA synthetase 4-like [Phoenix dactylifera]|uniref:Long chain acyl-CoA synthetase 4-like n=1 Tax=Phoenix dactylifera TaxID=42345 RepID=A0A8B9AH11_PHODC|nr:long chain acyl-CoA synthetase 4-like [Phoenix dactylifera]
MILFQIWIYGNSFESFLVAIVNPNKQALEHWAEENEISGDYPALCENPREKEYIRGELSKIAKAKKLKGFEFIKAVHLDPVPFDIEHDLLTPKYSKKRPQLLKHYQVSYPVFSLNCKNSMTHRKRHVSISLLCAIFCFLSDGFTAI